MGLSKFFRLAKQFFPGCYHACCVEVPVKDQNANKNVYTRPLGVST